MTSELRFPNCEHGRYRIAITLSLAECVQYMYKEQCWCIGVKKLTSHVIDTMIGGTQVIQCDPSSLSFHSSSETPDISCSKVVEALQTASHHLLTLLQPVAFPTETVYGLGASALNVSATSRIFAVKGRPPDNPLIVHVSSFKMLYSLLPNDYQLSRSYQVLIKHFWPGALTLLFPNNPAVIHPTITANQPTVAIRMPSHPIARALIAVANCPLAAPSANSSGKPSPTRAEHVLRDLDGKIGLVLDGGACSVGLESTVVDGLNEDGNIRVLRPGGVTVEDIEKVLRENTLGGERTPKVLVHQRDYRDESLEQAPSTPGMKYRHYSPRVPVILLFTSSPPPPGIDVTPALPFLAALRDKIPNASYPLKVGLLTTADSPLAHSALLNAGIQWHRYLLGLASEPWTVAHHLFDGLFTLEGEGVDVILMEEVKEEKEGLAIMNRVKKAATESIWIKFN